MLRATGLEYENLLHQKMKELDIPFMTEEDLRIIGYPKTPDVKLSIPFGIYWKQEWEGSEKR